MDFERYMDCISRYFSLEYNGEDVLNVVEAALEAYNFGLSVPDAAGNLIKLIRENSNERQG